MKTLNFLFMTLLMSSCNPFTTLKWGYYWNPERVLKTALESVTDDKISINERLDKWFSVTERFPYCKYGSKEGNIYLRRVIPKDISSLQIVSYGKQDIDPRTIDNSISPYKVISAERYDGEIFSRNTGKTIAIISIICRRGDKQASCSIDQLELPNALPFTGNEVCDGLRSRK